MARVLIVEGADRGLRLARELIDGGHAVRVVASAPEHCEQVRATGAECLIGTPDRLGTLRGALEHVTIACWLLADAGGDPELVRALHGSRLEQFLSGAIDSTMRGFLYESGGSALPADVRAEGERIVSETAARNSIPAAIVGADPHDLEEWLEEARWAVSVLLEARRAGAKSRYAGAHIPESRSVFHRSAFHGETSTREDS